VELGAIPTKVNAMSKLSHASCALFLCMPAIICSQQSSNQAGASGQATSQQTSVLIQSSAAAPVNAADGRIKLDVVVTDAKGAPVAGLTQQDFTLQDNGQSRQILSFNAFAGASHPPDPPVQAIVLLDAVNMRYSAMVQARADIDRFLRANGGHLALPTVVFVFTEQGLRAHSSPPPTAIR
jgi:hypothetical protein